jgi:signal peptidase I
MTTSRQERWARPAVVARFVVGLVALAAVQFAASLALVAAVASVDPRTTPVAVTSGSMRPAIDVGDVVVARPQDEVWSVGDIVVFEPDGSEGLVTHRVVEVADDGTYTTRGDANVDADSTPLGADDIVGRAELVVPWVGAPAVWLQQGAWGRLGVAVLVGAATLYLGGSALAAERDPWARPVEPVRRPVRVPAPVPAVAAPTSPRARRARRGRLALALLLLVGAAMGVGSSSARFGAATVNGANDVTAAASFPCAHQPTLAFLTGMENGPMPDLATGLFDSFGVTGGVPDNTTVRRNGDFALRIPKNPFGGSWVENLIGAPVIVDRMAIMLGSRPGSNVAQLAAVETTSGSRVDLGYRASDQRFTFGFSTGTRAASTVQVEAGRWYVMEYRVDVSANPRRAEWRIDGTAQTTLESAEAAANVRAQFLGSKTNADSYTAFYDDLARSYTAADYPLGDGRVLAMQPSALTTVGTAAFTSNGSGAAALRITSHLTYIAQTTLDGNSYISVDFADTTSGCVRGVLAIVSYSSSSPFGANAARTSVMVGGAERVVRSGTHVPSTPPPMHYSQVVVTPPTGTWTPATLNATTARIGFATDVDPQPRWNGLLLQYDTRLASSPTPG